MGRRVAIIGGGISGLTTGYLLQKQGVDVTLFESSPQVGGNIRSEVIDGFLIEHGPNSLLRSLPLVDLIDSLDLRSQILAASPDAKKRFVLIDGRLRPMPDAIASFGFGGFFSFGAKLRLLLEPFIRTKAAPEESVAHFFERRLGREVVLKAVDPFISGIFAGDPERLSIESAFPMLSAYERDHGSLLWGAIRSERKGVDRSFPRSFSFNGGLQTLTDSLAASLSDRVRISTAVQRVEKTSGGYIVSPANEKAELFDAFVISTKAESAAAMIEPLDGSLSQRLREIYYSPITVVRSGYSSTSVTRPAVGFGFLVPRNENRKILGSLFTSSVFPGRAIEGTCLFTSFVGGARSPELCDLSDDDTAKLVHTELAAILGITEEPVFLSLTRWKNAIPQYNIGYKDTVRAIENFTSSYPGAFVCSNFYRGISVGDCVKNAYRTADEIHAFIGSN